MLRGIVVGVLAAALLVPAAAVTAEPGQVGLAAAAGPTDVTTKTAGSGAARGADQRVADELVARREQPFRPSHDVVTTAAAGTIVQEYYDTCGDSTIGDLDRLFHLDDQAALVSWEWTTCVGGAFRGNEDEVLLFSIDEDLNNPQFRAAFVIIQYMDGWYEVYRTLGQDQVADWPLVDRGFGQVGRTVDGRTVGNFVVDAVAADLPFEYHFEVATFDGSGLLDTLPNADQFFPTFPTICSLVFFSRAHLTVAAGQLPAVRRAVQGLGLTITSEAPAIGSIAVEPVTDELLDRLEDVPGVVAAERPQPRRLDAVNDPEPTAWALDQLGLEAAWDIVASHPVHVAVIDSGVDARRPDLTGRVGAGFDGVMRRAIPAGANSAMGDHGTAVAGVIGATRNNGRDVVGVNDQATIRPVRISGHDGCISSESVVSALDAVVGMREVRLVNMSFGGPPSVVETAALDRVAAAGIIMVAATGNDGAEFPNRPLYPAAHPQVIGVGASTVDGQVAPYSQQAAVDLIAPGGTGGGSRATDIGVLGRFDAVDFESGTSFSAPYVTGALSLWLAANPQATTDQARAALQAAAVDVPGTTADGAGILDVSRLLDGAEPPRFTDTRGTTHDAAIEALADAGITGGFADGTFRPQANVTRGQMAAFLTRALELPTAEGSSFTDTAGTTHEAAIEALAAAGITGGFADGTFRPEANVTRGQMAAFLTRALGLG
jgi:hypothetical protein